MAEGPEKRGHRNDTEDDVFDDSPQAGLLGPATLKFGRSTFSQHRWTMINIILVMTQILMVIVLYAQLASQDTSSTVRWSFGRDYDFMSLDPEFDHLWGGEEIEQAGVIVLKEEDGRYNDIEYGAISMFHQLHCLRSIRKAMQLGYEQRLMAMDWRLAKHWPHCLYYLRQSIICNANDFIEHEEALNGTTGFIDGASDTRQCRSTQSLYDLYARKGISKQIEDEQ